MRIAKFAKGQVVKHVTSGQHGVVVLVHGTCMVHGMLAFLCDKAPGRCKFNHSGTYVVNTAFGIDVVAHEETLEESPLSSLSHRVI